jgi:hypothetical protein
MSRLCIIRVGFMLLVSVFSFCSVVNADFRSPGKVIVESEADAPTCVYAADLDGDGDFDVISVSRDDNKIAWYENDGFGQFGPQEVITTSAFGAGSVHVEDLDGDGDLDILSASSGDDKIAWYENDGTGQFGTQQVITTQIGGETVYAADLDGDGDPDVLSTSYEWPAGKIAWYENDGFGQFGSQQVITTSAFGAQSVYAADLDADGDLDVLSASVGGSKIAWYANEGPYQFGSQHFEITYYDNYNYDTDQWDAWQSDATPRDAWDDKYLADDSSGHTVFTDHAFTSIAVFNLKGNLFTKDKHESYGEDWNPMQSIGDHESGQSAHHVFAAVFKGLIYLEEGDVLTVTSDEEAFVFLDDDTKWGQEVLSVPYIYYFVTDSMTVTASQAGYHMMTVKFIERQNIHSGIEITLNGKHLQSAVVFGFEDFETGKFSKSSWRHSGDSTWTILQQEKHAGAYSAEAGTISDDEYTTLEITLDCVSGNITFHRKVSSESGFDYLKFYIDGVKKGAWSGEEDWAEVSFQVDEGTRTFEWTYSKDDSVSEGDDSAWIDDIAFPLKRNPPVGPEPPAEPNSSEGFDLYLDDIAPNIENVQLHY